MSTQRPLPPPRRILLASYASDPDLTRGRLHAVSDSPTRTPFQRDRDRIIHSTAFRRLKHKTQVFVHHEGDHYRTRLTHTIEVSQVARSIARSLVLDEDLAEAVALAHDLGHPPFGHSGEDTLNDVMEPFGGFDHNAQSLKIVTALERRYAEYDGLNLSWETIEGIVKHNGPLTEPDGRPIPRYAARGVPETIVNFDRVWPLRLDSHSSLEAQAAALADDIAYDAHDVDDGVHAGLFELDDLRAVPMVARFLEDIDSRHPGLDPQRRSAEIVRRILASLIDDAIACTAQRLVDLSIETVEDARAAGRTLVTFSIDMAKAERELKDFLFARMYRHPQVEAVRVKAKSILHDLFDRFMSDLHALPAEWRPAEPIDQSALARRVCDYMAGMTDRYAVSAHRRLFDATPDLR